MPIVTWDHLHLRSPDPEATAPWLENILGGRIIPGPGRLRVKLGGAAGFMPTADPFAVRARPGRSVVLTGQRTGLGLVAPGKRHGVDGSTDPERWSPRRSAGLLPGSSTAPIGELSGPNVQSARLARNSKSRTSM